MPANFIAMPRSLWSSSYVGIHSAVCEPPVAIKAGNLERFKVRVTDTGFAWNGGLRLTLLAGKVEKLQLLGDSSFYVAGEPTLGSD
jgi:hypothetical protein